MRENRRNFVGMTPWAAAWSLRGVIIPAFIGAFSFAVSAHILIGGAPFEGRPIPKIVAIPLIVLGVYCAILGFKRFVKNVLD